jgi:hypothetical protein
MTTLDLRKELKYLYTPSAKRAEVVRVPAFKFAMIDGGFGAGETPDTSPVFAQATGALYSIAYTLKFMSKGRPVDPVEYPVMALEGQWWIEEGEFSFDRKDNWRWNLMILQPDHITQEMFGEAVRQAETKHPNPALARLRLERFEEGLCVQIMHIGPYAAESATVDRLHAFARESGCELRGKHHEIYLGDPRRSAPEKLKTILRMPVEKVA